MKTEAKPVSGINEARLEIAANRLRLCDVPARVALPIGELGTVSWHVGHTIRLPCEVIPKFLLCKWRRPESWNLWTIFMTWVLCPAKVKEFSDGLRVRV